MTFLGILIMMACFSIIGNGTGGGNGITDTVTFASSNRTYVFTNLSTYERGCLKQVRNYDELAVWMRTFNKWQN